MTEWKPAEISKLLRISDEPLHHVAADMIDRLAVSERMVEDGAKAFFAITHKPVGMNVDESWASFADTIHNECRRIARAVLVGAMANHRAVAEAEVATLRAELNEVEKVVRPFALRANAYHAFDDQHVIDTLATGAPRPIGLEVGDLRRAAAFRAKYGPNT